MKVKAGKKDTFSITEMTETELMVLIGVLDTTNDRCFEEQGEDGQWYSNDDFVLLLSDDQRSALRRICAVWNK